MNCEEKLTRDILLFDQLRALFKVDIELEFMIHNYKSMFLSIEKERSRVVAVERMSDTKTKRSQLFSIKTKDSDDLSNSIHIYKASIFVSLFRQIKTIYEIENIENDLKTVNSQLRYMSSDYFHKIN
jgi:hypothetical protein